MPHEAENFDDNCRDTCHDVTGKTEYLTYYTTNTTTENSIKMSKKNLSTTLKVNGITFDSLSANGKPTEQTLGMLRMYTLRYTHQLAYIPQVFEDSHF